MGIIQIKITNKIINILRTFKENNFYGYNKRKKMQCMFEELKEDPNLDIQADL